MALVLTQQLFEAIKRSTRPLICIPSHASTDAIASALGLFSILKKLDKNPVIVSTDGAAPKNIHFLADYAVIKKNLEHLQQFVIELDATKTKVDELSYELKNEKLFISLSPKQGFWSASDVRTSTSGYRYDLIFCIGAADLESLGEIYQENSDFFFRTPIINIDHTAENEHFGQINLVDMTASACGEVCYDMVESIDSGLLDEEIATAFLTGMIAKTKSFKSKNITPKTLQTASKLMAKGAKRDTIVQNLYRTRNLSTLRLWGRALARLKFDEHAHLIWTLLSAQDFMHAGAQEEDLPDIIDELLSSSPHARVTVLIFENAEHVVKAIVRTEQPQDAIALCAPFHASGTREQVYLQFPNKSIPQTETLLLTHLKRALTKKDTD